MTPGYSALVGERLRNIRLQKGMSLHDVETQSSKEFKASVVGAYERGERSVSVPRLQRLARFYGVPVDHLLPRDPSETAPERPVVDQSGKVRINLQILESIDAPEKGVLKRYLTNVQVLRGDFNGRVLTIRSDDVRAIASVLDLTPDLFVDKIEELGLAVR